MLSKTDGKVNQIVYWGRPLDWHNQTLTPNHYEIACYRVLIAAATEAGVPEVARLCEQSLREEEAMAEWLGQRLPEVTCQYLQREATGQEAKR